MAEYLKLTTWVAWSKSARPYAEELLSNEVYVYTSAIAINALFSFTPFVILIVSISRYFFPGLGIDTMIYEILGHYLPFTNAPAPPSGRSDLEFIVRNIRIISAGFGKAQLVSTLLLIWSVASVFIPLEMALNRALGVSESRGFWRSQWLAMRLVVAMGGLAFLFIAGATATRAVISFIIPAEWWLPHAIFSFINVKAWMVPLTLLLSCLVFYLAPNAKVPFREVWPAAILTGLLWEISNYIFVVVLPFMGLYELFGPLYIAVSLLTWAYFGGLILVLGANLMAKRVLTSRIEKMKEELWNFKTESPL
jgi:membrane protein